MSSAPSPRRARRGLLLVAAALLAVMLVAVLAAARLDGGFLRARIEAAGRTATGRTVTVAGPIRLSFLPAPAIAADDVTIGNVSGGSRPDMARMRRVVATIDPLALLEGRVVLRSLALLDPDLLLERGAGGRPNWLFTPLRRAGGGGGPAGAHGERPALAITSLSAVGGRIRWRDGPAPVRSGAIGIDHLLLQQHDPASSLTLFLAGRHGTTPFTLSLAAAPPETLAKANATTPFAVRGTLDLAGGETSGPPDTIALDGAFADPTHGRGFAGSVRARLHDLADLDALFPHAGLPSARAVSVEARLEQTPEGAWSATRLVGSLGAAEPGRLAPGVRVSQVSVSAPGPDAPIVVHASGTLQGQPATLEAPALGTLRAWSGEGGPAKLEAEAAIGASRIDLAGTVGRGAGGDATLTAATRLAVPDPAALAAEIGGRLDRHDPVVATGTVTVTRDRSGALTLRFAASALSIDGERFGPADLVVRRAAGGGVTNGSLAVDGAAPWLTWRRENGPQGIAVTVHLAGHLVPAALAAAVAGLPPGITGRLDVAGTLGGPAARGGIERAHLDGSLAATVVDGAIGGEAARVLLQPAIAATRLPLDGAERFRCAGIDATITDGVAHVRSLSLDSRTLAVDGAGTVGLGAGTLSLHLRPSVRLGIAAASAPLVVGGTVDHPSVALAHDAAGRVGISVGGAAPAPVACDANADVAALPVAATRKPRAADLLRDLGRLFR